MAGTHHRGSNASSSSAQPKHVGFTIPSDQQNESHDPEETTDPVPDCRRSESHDSEKLGHHDQGPTATTNENEGMAAEEEDADMDALINDLESEDGHDDHDYGNEIMEAGGAKPVAEKLLQTSTTHGLTEAEVLTRRRKFGLNQMKEEKPNKFLIFLGFFVGPIQFVMEVSSCAILIQYTLQPDVVYGSTKLALSIWHLC